MKPLFRFVRAVLAKLQMFSGAIRFEHTLFALPFAYIGMFLAADGLPTFSQFAWITVAMIGARTVAMAANRLAHYKEDSANPRTAGRSLPMGLIKPRDMWLMMIVSTGIFLFAASQLNSLAFALAPVALVFLFLYNYTKYVTWGSHWVLGFTDAIAPAGAWIGVTGVIYPEAILLAFAVAMWISGFDIVYACLDYEFDRGYGIHSIPRRFGIAKALVWTKAMHLMASVSFLALGIWMNLDYPYYIGWVIMSVLLIYQNRLVHPGDLSKVNLAAFRINTYIGLILLLFTALAKVL